MGVSVRLYRDESGGKRETWQLISEWHQSYLILRAFSEGLKSVGEERNHGDDHNGCYILISREELVAAASSLAGLAIWEDEDYRAHLLSEAQGLRDEVHEHLSLEYWLFEWDN